MRKSSVGKGLPSSRQGNVTSTESLRRAETEACLLGLALREGGDLSQQVVIELTSEDFTRHDCRRVYDAIRSLSDNSRSVNPVSVADISGQGLEAIEGLLRLAGNASVTDTGTFIKELKTASSARKVVSACQTAVGKCSSGEPLDEVMAELETHLYHNGASGLEEAKEASSVAQNVVSAVMARADGKGPKELSTGLIGLDRAIIGFRPGKMMVVGARPSMGKSALAGTFTKSVLKQGLGVLTFSLEMDAEELLERAIGEMAAVDVRKVMSGRGMDRNELSRVVASADRFIRSSWYIDDRTYSIGGIRRRARIVQGKLERAGRNLGLIIIDYLQLGSGGANDSRERAIGEMSRGIKLLSKECGCTVLALSQLNRACELRDNKRPMLSDLRESGTIEQDADVVAFLFREHMYNKAIDPSETELIIAKQRGGPTGVIRLLYNPKLVAFIDPEVDYYGKSNGASQGGPSSFSVDSGGPQISDSGHAPDGNLQ